jgi:hypothetical protein
VILAADLAPQREDGDERDQKFENEKRTMEAPDTSYYKATS